MQALVVLRTFNAQSGSRRAMAKAKGVRRRQQAGVKGVRQKLDHYQVLVLCAAGKKYPEIAAELGISIARVARIVGKQPPKR